MKSKANIWIGCISVVALSILILDAPTAIKGAQDGISLCINVIVPSLFPFFVISVVLNSILAGTQWNFLHPIGKLCGIPVGGESLLMLGLLGGYPVGAQCINDAYHSKIINKNTAQRMLGFCNNAGPAFIFGMLGSVFSTKVAPWCVWGTHILSAVIVGLILPFKENNSCAIGGMQVRSLSSAIEIAIKNLGKVCGWVILFRVFIVFCQRWFMWLLPTAWQCVIAGILELSNGCLGLASIPNEGLRYILATAFINFGGLCVAMQTKSVTEHIGTGMYFPGKLLQTCISIILAWITQSLVFPPENRISVPWWICFLLIIPCIYPYLQKAKKVVAIPRFMVYNK